MRTEKIERIVMAIYAIASITFIATSMGVAIAIIMASLSIFGSEFAMIQSVELLHEIVIMWSVVTVINSLMWVPLAIHFKGLRGILMIPKAMRRSIEKSIDLWIV